MKNKYTIVAALSAPLLVLALMASVASAATLTRSLDIGMSGSDVTALQQYLAQDSTIYPQGLVTGYFGSLTAAAVARWQSAHGIDAVGRVGPITLAALNTAMGGGTVGTGVDVSAPIITFNSANASSNAATVQWVTNENASGRVMYGTSWPFLYASAPSASDGGGFSRTHSAAITGLAPNTKYYYTIESTDPSGNLQWYIGNSVTTHN